MTTLLALSLLSTPAAACGGFFCNASQPVDQVGERILFSHDPASGTVEMHVQVSYAGPSEDFSWLLPVPTEPEIFLSVDDVLARLGTATNPTFIPTTETVGNCPDGMPFGSVDMAMSDSAPEEAGGVTVEAEGQVGPYATQLLTATDTGSLVTWLTENGYDLPTGAEEKLGLYVQEGGWFVGLKLLKDRSAGDLAPIGLRFEAGDPMIPLQLTAVAAGDDMPLQPFLLGASRAVPENYLHVGINPFAVDWLNGAANYLSVIGQAADEAGGQAFTTDFAGPTSSVPVHLYAEGQYDTASVAAVDDAYALAGMLQSLGYIFPGDTSWMEGEGIPVTTGTIPILKRHVAKPPRHRDVDDATFYGCLDCFVNRGEVPVDGAALAADLEAGFVTPMKRVQELLDTQPYLTRLTSSISADEMTVDPRFVYNPDMGDVASGRTATLRVLCRGTKSFSEAPRELVLPDGRTLALPSVDAWFEEGWTWEAWIGEVGAYAAETVEQTGRSGAALLVTDNRGAIDEALATVRSGCGCDTSTPGGLAAAAGLLGLALRRRRR